MGIFGSSGYVPSEREKWQMAERDAREARARYDKDQREARRISDEQQRLLQREAEQAEKEQQSLVEKGKKELMDLEKSLLTQPITRTAGGSAALVDSPLIVWHWRCPMPADIAVPVEGVRRDDAGALLALWHGGGIDPETDIVPDALRAKLGSRPAYREWMKTVNKVLPTVEERYPILAHLRDDRAWERLLRPTGVLSERKDVITETGALGTYQRPVTITELPTIIAAEITPEGLVLTLDHMPGITASTWAKKLDALRAAFNAAGVHDASYLRTRDGNGGEVILDFRDVPTEFPKAVASTPRPFPKTEQEAVAAYPKLHWRFGVDARGNERSARILDASHIAIVAKTNWGKSILAASLLENLRPYGSWMVFDGKGSDHSAKMAEEPGVTWISKTAAQHLLGMKWLHEEMHERIAAADEALARGADKTQAFNFPPIFGLLDEIPSMRQRIEELLGADALAKFDRYVEDILQLGRQARIHLVLVTQSLYVASFPTEWQKNVSRMVFLGPVASRSMVSDEIPKDVADAVEFMSARIPDSAKGRATLLEKSDSGAAPIQVQTYFDWAPGSTSMGMAPTPEVAEVWETQRQNLVGRPLLFDRIGLQVDSPEWATQPLAVLLDTPTVIVADEHGAIEGMEKYDLLSPHFAGKAAAAQLNPNRARGRGSGVAGKVVPQPEPAGDAATPPTSRVASIQGEQVVRGGGDV
ncbi:ATP synthase subunit B family protein [Mycobacteroides abscessus]|uniref:hypothetical protein n=1 Tax=Mycobacteroides abscessus TaxID=36809 RepID=UPI00092B0827|nr:hypothetical protein [Mycobacteroides abscessus]SHP98384.1 DNA segregation ATPase, FtsK/SpoIIIE family [Mycobacteroides abscessus subsp. abscessus]SHQ61004.1 DNA segregation ATPase, FtsK/SpoIIIE family [Mycobacteroides abscessus subsp. abscessus]SKD63561.1 DNA segregation ATPase, FtsK/SpoIIIE family [Mycobacteroides abscessus subsp. abscessus]SLD63024.1 DNA segregation ATPase, FtsK/SpoIIIE family [Mycobacteroides abscessus subsp. abscessus]